MYLMWSVGAPISNIYIRRITEKFHVYLQLQIWHTEGSVDFENLQSIQLGLSVLCYQPINVSLNHKGGTDDDTLSVI